MRIHLLTIAALGLLAACGPTIQAACADRHGSGTDAAKSCVQSAEREILTGPGSAFAKSQRGGGG